MQNNNKAISNVKFFFKNKKMSKSLIQEDKSGEIVLTDKLSEDFSKLYISGDHSDLTLVVGGERIKCESKT
jgi:hypothetical protein